ncbi:hypothetical protein LEMLEM_LOCUS486 [Lemmus lemmus]
MEWANADVNAGQMRRRKRDVGTSLFAVSKYQSRNYFTCPQKKNVPSTVRIMSDSQIESFNSHRGQVGTYRSLH